MPLKCGEPLPCWPQPSQSCFTVKFCIYKEVWQSTCGCRGTAAQILLTTFDVCLQLQGKVTSALATTGDQLGAYAYMG